MTSRIMNRSGMASLFIAVGIVSLLAGMSLVNSMQAGLMRRKQIERLNRFEAFYTNEISAWHARARGYEGLSVADVEFENRPYENISLPADEYSSSPGTPLNIATSKRFAPAANLIRRLAAGKMESTAPASGHYCGKTDFGGKSAYRVCLRELASPPSGPAWLFGFGGAANGSVDAGGALTFPVHFWAIARDGKPVTGFGTNGHVEKSIGASAANSDISYAKSAPCSTIPGCNEPDAIYFNNALGLYRFSGTDGRGMGNGMSGSNEGLLGLFGSQLRTFKFLPPLLTFGESMYVPYKSNSSGPNEIGIGWQKLAPGGQGTFGTYSKGTDYRQGVLDWTLTANGKVKVLVRQEKLLSDGQTESWHFTIAQFRQDANGPNTLDPTFGTNGIVELSPPAGPYAPRTAKFQNDGTIRVICSHGPTDTRIYHLLSDGQLDTSFGTSGGISLPPSGDGSFLWSIARDKSFYLLNYQFSNPISQNGSGSARITRFRSDGAIDSGFGQNGTVNWLDVAGPPMGVGSFSYGEVLITQSGSLVATAIDSPATPMGLLPRNMLHGFGCGDAAGIAIVHLSQAGEFDSTFGNGGEYGFPGRHFLCAPPKGHGVGLSSWALAE